MRRIGIDLDGVLANFNEGFARILEGVTGQPITLPKEGPEIWDWPVLFAPPEHVNEAWSRLKHYDLFWRSLNAMADPDIDDAFKLLEGAACDGDDLYFITSRVGRMVQYQSADWIKFYTGICYPSVLVCHRKPIAAIALELDAMIDDFPPNLALFDGTQTKCYLVNRPWNAGAEGRFERVNSCAEALQRIFDE